MWVRTRGARRRVAPRGWASRRYAPGMSPLMHGARLLTVILMALPPLSPDAREKAAQVILVGTIEAVEQHAIAVAGGTDLLFVARVKVRRREKTLLASSEPEPTAEVHFRRTGTRPPGWAGPAGQSSVPPEHREVRLFCRYDQKGVLQLLEPNGWELVGKDD